MKSIRCFMLFRVLILAIGVLGASAAPAYAQSAGGKFTLAHETRWGRTVLAPGDYTFSLQSPSFPAQVIVRGAAGTMAFVMPWLVSSEQLTDSSRLELSRSPSGESFVSALYLGDLGLSLHYSAPKAQASETAKLSPMADSQPGK